MIRFVLWNVRFVLLVLLRSDGFVKPSQSNSIDIIKDLLLLGKRPTITQ